MHPSPRQNPPSFMSRLPWRPSRWVGIGVAVALAMAATMAVAQPASPSTDRLIRMNGALPVAAAGQAASTEPVEFSIYDQETGGSLLWQETQVLAVDGRGAYTAFLGASTDGLPVELFAGGAARWLSVQRPGGPAATRTLLTAVPYAVSAANADTLAGRPATDYLLTPAARQSRAGTDADPSTSDALTREPDPRVNNGTTGYIGKFFNTVDLDSSALFQSGASIGLNTTTPLDIFHSRFTNAGGTQTGLAVQNLSNSTTAYSGMLFYDHTGALRQFQGYNNGTGEYRINNISPSGSINFMIGGTSRFQVRNDGDINISGGIRKGGSLFISSAGTNTAVGESALVNNTSGSGNTAIGYTALVATTTGYDNTASGDRALQANTTGFRNTATGAGALAANTAGIFNTASGYRALHANTTGNDNTASGFQALYSNITGNGNTATGSGALTANTTAGDNTAVGYAALASSTTGGLNAAVGSGALALNTTGSENTAAGAFALAANTTGIGNAAVGRSALPANTVGAYNSAFGTSALFSNTTGSGNTAIGQFALGQNVSGTNNTAVGYAALSSSTAGENIALGILAGGTLTSGSDNIYIGNYLYPPSGSEGNTIRIGNGQTRNFAAGIRGVTTGTNNAIPVVIDSNGQLGTISSSRRFKEDIRDMGEASRRLWQLRPVTFRYAQAYTDGSKPVHYGLVAEEVAAVFPELAVTNASGGVDTVHYETLSVLLLNEVQRLERDRTALTARLERERAAMAAELADLRAAVAALTATTGKQ